MDSTITKEEVLVVFLLIILFFNLMAVLLADSID